MSGDSKGYIAALDIGTTTIRCQVFDHQGRCKGSSFDKVKLHYPASRAVEINPDELWTSTIGSIKAAIKDADVCVPQIRSLAIATQRATFVTWRKDNGKMLHNFITWKDLRATEIVDQLNKSWKMNILRTGSSLAHLLSRQTKFGIVANLKFTCSHVIPRLLWVFQNSPEVRSALQSDNLQFGTVDTWLLYKLTKGKTYMTDVSNASATGLYDPFTLCWSFIPTYLDIPLSILPPVVANDYDFGETASDILGAPVKIGALMADQSASMFGSLSIQEGNVKVTLGTGAFLNINTGEVIQGGDKGVYPLVGWKVKGKVAYLNEVACSDAGSLVQWMLGVGLISNVLDISDLINQTNDSDGVYFVPAFSGLGPPINDESAASGFIGIKAGTRKEHMVRAVIESVAYRIVLAYNMIYKTEIAQELKVDGGVSRNDFLCQLLADLTGVKVRRTDKEMSTLGVAYVAGSSCGFWSSHQEIAAITRDEDVFEPISCAITRSCLDYNFKKWQKAAERFKHWYL